MAGEASRQLFLAAVGGGFFVEKPAAQVCVQPACVQGDWTCRDQHLAELEGDGQETDPRSSPPSQCSLPGRCVRWSPQW